MKNITKLPNRVKEFLTETAIRVAISSGFIKGRRGLTGCSFAQALVLGNLSDADCNIERMCQLLHEESVIISKQGLDFRFSNSAVDFMRSMYEKISVYLQIVLSLIAGYYRNLITLSYLIAAI
ncbi:hypothetical protein [Rickettsia endosymbiont of Cantharis rufa]|uniref:hypothetical protein n=1 Tax=Rickettsia endosymbiont of Cantharis rufa TaxID=3066248 RepID=UPI0031329F90